MIFLRRYIQSDNRVPGLEWSSGILFDRLVALNNILKVLLHFDVSILWLSGGRGSKGQK